MYGDFWPESFEADKRHFLPRNGGVEDKQTSHISRNIKASACIYALYIPQ